MATDTYAQVYELDSLCELLDRKEGRVAPPKNSIESFPLSGPLFPVALRVFSESSDGWLKKDPFLPQSGDQFVEKENNGGTGWLTGLL